jgi:hypothetical protein
MVEPAAPFVKVVVVDTSATGLMMSVSVALLLPGVGSVTPTGAVMVAVLTIVPLADGVPVTVKVTEPPLGRVGITMPAPCIKTTVVLATLGQTAAPTGVPQVTPLTLKLATDGSVKMALFAGLGPVLLTTIV